MRVIEQSPSIGVVKYKATSGSSTCIAWAKDSPTQCLIFRLANGARQKVEVVACTEHGVCSDAFIAYGYTVPKGNVCTLHFRVLTIFIFYHLILFLYLSSSWSFNWSPKRIWFHGRTGCQTRTPRCCGVQSKCYCRIGQAWLRFKSRIDSVELLGWWLGTSHCLFRIGRSLST